MAKGKGLNRRDFLKRTGAAAASAAAARVPALPSGPPAIAPIASGLDPRAILPPAFTKGFSLPHTGGEIVMLDGDAVVWNEDFLGGMTKDQMLEQRAILENARRAMPEVVDRPMAYNHLTKQWHEQALRDAVPPGGSPDSWQQIYLKAGHRAPDAHSLLQTEQYLPEEFAESAYSGGTLTAGPQAYEGQNLVSGYEDAWWNDRRGVLRYELSQKGGNAKEMAKTEDGIRLLQESGIAPGGRFQSATMLLPEANAMGASTGLPGDMPRERTGRIRRLLSLGVPAVAAAGVASTASAQGLPTSDGPQKSSGDDNPDLEKFRANVAKVLHTPYIRRDVAAPHGAIGTRGVEDDLTPMEFMDGVLAFNSLGAITAEERQEIIDNAAAVLMGEPLDDKSEAGQQGREMANLLLGVMKSQTPGNAKALDASVSQQQFDKWTAQSGNDANFRLTENGQRNFTRQAAYDLLRTMQEGEHAPAYADTLSRGLSWVGGWFDRDTSENYNDLANNPGPLGRAKVANRWWDQANMSRGSFRGDAFSDSAHFPGWSSTTGEGLGRIMSEDTSNWLARSAVPFQRFFSPAEAQRTPQGNVDKIGGRTSLLASLNDAVGPFNTANEIDINLKRTTPINPGFSPTQFRQVLASRADLEQRGNAFERSYWPDVQKTLDAAVPTRMLYAKPERTWGTPLSESVMKLPQNTLGDPITAGVTAASAGGGAVMGALSGAGKGASALGRLASVARGGAKGAGAGLYAAGADMAKDAPFDLATEQAIGATAYDSLGDWAQSMVQPIQDNPLMGSVRPDDPELAEKRSRQIEGYNREWSQLMRMWDKAKSDAKQYGYPVQNR